ncbi:UDP-N-acetylmuramoyl-tripeptide--D-alanyl-D-alanine ligase [Synechococcus sp. CBW1107]|uniref:UDP-N-acetylmuramoyl-tripeptide--D-alanyl-D- alanine ligase n=2 Tax=unclassified Synechococcus TaxID=2626047 RepID=UPI001E44C34F|nr:UDP-N-acetylmuramoyl-tripeptide--D-alanyl-D-alanine ligase [Synechococcus sp. CBW1107]
MRADAMQLANLVELWGPPIEAAAADPAARFSRIGTDSRELEPGCLFVPLVGERFDGHRFLAAALEQGALGALAQRDRLSAGQAEDLVRSSGGRIWLVDDTQAAYQELGRLWRRQGSAPVIAVTGSAGKTTTRELIRAVLSPLGPVLASVGNENNDIGVPLTLLKAGAEHRAVVVEMGMRGLGEIERLSRCAEPDITVITNIGTAHIGRLGSREAIATAKCEIVTALRPDGLVVIPAGDPLLEASLAAVWSGRVMRVALHDDPAGPQPAQLLGRLQAGADGGRLLWGEAEPGASEHSTGLPLPGRHNARNLLLALAVARELGVDPLQLRQLEVTLPGGRSRRIRLGEIEVLDETYNASPEAMLAALDLLGAQPGRRFAALGTMLELGEQSTELHRRVGERARALGLDGLVIVAGGAEGEALLAGAAGLPRLQRLDSPAEAAQTLLDWLEPGDHLLLKASRGVALERLLPLLERGLSPAAGSSRP